MNCPSADKLSQYVDELLEKQEHQAIKLHVNECENCQRVIRLFEGETQFIKETLQMPVLPDTFDEQVLAQLQPYKKKHLVIKKGMATAAAAVLSIGLLAAVSPSLANFVMDIFGSEQVDPGINEAQKLGFVEQVNYEQTNKGITIHINEVMVDTKRIALVVHATNKRGKIIKWPRFGEWSKPYEIEFTKKNGEPIGEFSFGAGYSGNETFSVLQIDTPKLTEDLLLQWKINEVNDKQGEWQFTIPIPIEKALSHLKTVDIQQTITAHNLEMTVEQALFTPSTATLNYNMKLIEPLPKDSRYSMMPIQKAAYTIENAQGQVLAANDVYREYIEDEETVAPQLAGTGGGEASIWDWEDVYSTISDEKPVLQIAGFEVPVYINESMTFNANQLDSSATIMYENYPIQVVSLQKVEKGDESRFELKLQYDKELPIKFDSMSWYLVDESGTNHFINGKYEDTLIISKELDLQKTYTLTFLTATKFEKLNEPVQIPLYK